MVLPTREATPIGCLSIYHTKTRPPPPIKKIFKKFYLCQSTENWPKLNCQRAILSLWPLEVNRTC